MLNQGGVKLSNRFLILIAELGKRLEQNVKHLALHRSDEREAFRLNFKKEDPAVFGMGKAFQVFVFFKPIDQMGDRRFRNPELFARFRHGDAA